MDLMNINVLVATQGSYFLAANVLPHALQGQQLKKDNADQIIVAQTVKLALLIIFA
jgi:hypothetical protein